MNYKIVILTEAGEKIGFGHYTRCSALFQSLKENGNEVRMLVYLNDYVLNDTNITTIDWIQGIDEIKSQSASDIVIVDSYLASQEIYKKLKQKFHQVIAIDDYNRITYSADVVINPNVFFAETNYSNQSAECLGGKDYVILRPEFRNAQVTNSIRKSIGNILITIGGSDYRNLLPRLIEICMGKGTAQIHVIAPEGLEQIGDNEQLTIFPSQNAEGIVSRMQNADLVISACGQTLHELVSLGKPTIGICLDIDQVPNQLYYLKAGFLKHDIVWNDTDFEQKLLIAINDFMDADFRLSICELTHSLIDKNGIKNLVKVINHLVHGIAK
jgi:spore coat polysaccharide biosynthesis predicted glycosyltransferase SpsG